MISLLWKLRMFRHGRGPAAIAQHHAHIMKIKIPHKRLVVRLQRFKGPAVAVPCHAKQRRLHVFPLDRAVEGTEPVDHYFQLGRHAIVIKRRGKHHHICIQDLFAYDLHIVLLHTGAFIAAVDAPDTGMDFSVGCIDQFCGMARSFGPPA